MIPIHSWKVVPLSSGQLLDVREEDILEGGLYRRCDTLRGGGGYDLFPKICEEFLGESPTEQFVVQLQGCNLDCPYCYVTREGVWGKATRVTTSELTASYRRSGLPVFHLMGGAPALQLKWWPQLLKELYLTGSYIFHSDMTLTEGLYSEDVLRVIGGYRAIVAVNVKGTNFEEWFENTRKMVDWSLFWTNFRSVCKHLNKFYITYTNCDLEEISRFEAKCKGEGVDVESLVRYNIDLIDYNALPHVDDRAWGGEGRRT